jgi:LEA14-like dessication related protein
MRRPLLLALVPAAALAGCSGVQQMLGAAFEKPRLTYESFQPTELDLEGVTLALRYRVDNPNAVGLKLANLDYKVEVDGRQAVAGAARSGLSIPARGSAPLEIPVRVRYGDVPGLVQTLFTRDELPFHVEGNAGLSTPIGVIGLPFSYTGKIPTPKLPHIALTGISLHGVSLDGLSFDVKLEVRNPNAFQLPVGGLAYALKLGGSEVLGGARQVLGTVPAGGKTSIAIPVKIPFARAADAAGKLMRGQQADVQLDGSASFGSVQVPVNLGGKLGK